MAAKWLGEPRRLVKPLGLAIALSLVGILATLIGFAAGAAWGWRVVGALMVLTAAGVFLVAHANYLVPGFKAGYLGGKTAGAVAIASAAIGLAVLGQTKELAAWSYRVCRALPVAACQGAGSCANGDVFAIASPTRSVRAVRFTRSCDPKTGVSTQVSIVTMGDSLGEEPGNAFIVDGKADLILLWIDGKHLAISNVGTGAPRLQNTLVDGIHISYEERPR